MQLVKSVFILMFCLMASMSFSQNVKWLSWEEALALSEDNPKKIFVDVYTSWCAWCDKMEKNTIQKPHIAQYLNDNYYSVKFDAEYKEDIEFNGKVYKYIQSGKRGFHELAKVILRGQMSYPTVVFLDENLQIIQPIKGFQDATTFNQIIHYFGGDFHKNTPWQRYTKSFGRNENVVPVGN